MSPATDDPGRPFQEGEFALLVDFKGRHYLTRLARDETFYTHMGHVTHAEMIGGQEGSWVATNKGHLLLVFRPTLADFVLEMPRPRQVIYPKDLGAILLYADIFPGARVVEAGLGSGSLTMALLRAVGHHGGIVSYELREDVAEKALANINAMLPNVDNLTVRIADIYQGIQERDLDRIVLDLPEPWHVVPSAGQALVPGGIFLSFLPTVLQVHDLVITLNESGIFQLVLTQEVMLRSWHVTKRSVRPDHRMVAHTGFLVTARKTFPKTFRPGGDDPREEAQAHVEDEPVERLDTPSPGGREE